MIEEQDLRDRLDAVSVPPTRLTADKLVHAGRRRAFRRRSVQAACGVALATGLLVGVPSLVFRSGGPATDAAGQHGQQTVSCAVTKLPLPAGMTNVDPVAVDPSGRYILGNNIGKELDPPAPKAGMSELTPVLWTDGRPQVLPMVGRSVRASAVNTGGVVVAVSGGKVYDTVVRYVKGVPQKLTPPPGDWEFQMTPEINARGDIVASATRKNDPDTKAVVLLWTAGSTSATQLSLPAGSSAADITDDGTIVGTLVTGPEVTDLTAFAWDGQGGRRVLPVPVGQHGSPNSAQGDWATGNLWPSGTVARWNLRTGELTDLGIHAPANAINANGWIVSDGSVQRDDATVDLAAGEGERGEPLALSDNGVVLGQVFSDDIPTTVTGPFSWKCDG